MIIAHCMLNCIYYKIIEVKAQHCSQCTLLKPRASRLLMKWFIGSTPNGDVVQLVVVLALAALAAGFPDFDFDVEDIHQDQDIDSDNTFTGTYRYELQPFG